MPERGAGEQPVLLAARRTYRNAEFRLHVSGRMSELVTRGRAGVHPWCPDDLGGLPPVLRGLREANVATTSFVDGRLRVTHSDAYRASSARTRSIDLTTAGDVDALIVATLRRNGFEAVHRVVVAPAKGRSADAPPGTAVSLALDLAADEDAVVLLEHEACYTWLRPRHEASRDPQVVGRVAVFEFSVPAAGSSSRELGGVPAGAA